MCQEPRAMSEKCFNKQNGTIGIKFSLPATNVLATYRYIYILLSPQIIFTYKVIHTHRDLNKNVFCFVLCLVYV